MASAIFPLGMDDSFFGVTGECPGCDTACKTWPWFLFTGFTVIFSAIFSKLWRLNRIVGSAKRFMRVKVEPRDVMLPFAALFLLNVILLSVWTATDPLVWQRISIDDLNTYGTCKPMDGTPAKVLGSFLCMVNLGALLLAEIQAYKARNISDHLSESKYLGLATICMFQMFIIGVPIMFLVQESPEAKYFVFSGIIFLICATMLLLIFVPKIILHRTASTRRPTARESVGLNVQLPNFTSNFQSSQFTPGQSSGFSGGNQQSDGKVSALSIGSGVDDDDMSTCKPGIYSLGVGSVFAGIIQ
jgi:gamma-aminobutyric acid type B receptor